MDGILGKGRGNCGMGRIGIQGLLPLLCFVYRYYTLLGCVCWFLLFLQIE